jgi:4-amino-4-deoxy-L-arabinose transferase-like glycosyltransferase
MVLCLLVAAALRLPNLPDMPPGLHYDEAANGLLSADIGLRGDRPIFISSYTGKEVFFFYLAGTMMRLVGESVFALRLTAAFVGILTVAATYWLGREMLADRRIAILAAALLAVSFWHVLFSRLGFRAVTQPFLQALTLAALFRGLRRKDNRWLIIGGITLGLTAYTYLAARLFPVLLLIGLIPILSNHSIAHLRRRQIAMFAGSAFVVLLPLLVYFIIHPDAFWVRIGQVAPGSNAPGLPLWDSLLRSWGMFFLRGDPFWRFNLPGRPLFNWVWGGLLVVGWIASVIRWRRFPYDWQRAAITLLIFAPLVMILPTALATNELVPSNLRAIGLIPFVFFLPAIGVVILFHDIERRFGTPPVTFTVLFVALLVLLSGGMATAQAYFNEWAGETTLFFESDGDLATVARFLSETDLTDRTVYVAAPHYRHPTVAFLSEEYERVKWLPDADALVIPASGAALIVYPFNSPAPAWTMPYLNYGKRIDTVIDGTPKDTYMAFELLELPLPSIAERVDINFADTVTLLGYESASAEAGTELPVTLVWQVVNPPAADYMPFLQLEDSWGHRWSQVESFAYPAEQWETGETIIQQVLVPVPPGAPPGNYRLRIGLFDPGSDDRLPRLDHNGSYAGDAFFVENVEITVGDVPDDFPEPPFIVDDLVLPGLRLLGYERGGAAAEAGTPWGLSLWWLATELLPPLNSSIELVDREGTAHTVLETEPVNDTYPFVEWETPQIVIDHQILKLPLDFQAGDYRLRLRVLNPTDGSIFTADLGPLSVEVTERLFIPPAVDYALDATFGNEIKLLGYDLSAERDNIRELKLVWQAMQVPSTDYTVFVHVLDQDGTCCIWQKDAMPQQGQNPTSHWLSGEVVEDSYELILPPDLLPGEYPLEVGLYIAETGQRLLVEVPGELENDAAWLRPLLLP